MPQETLHKVSTHKSDRISAENSFITRIAKFGFSIMQDQEDSNTLKMHCLDILCKISKV